MLIRWNAVLAAVVALPLVGTDAVLAQTVSPGSAQSAQDVPQSTSPSPPDLQPVHPDANPTSETHPVSQEAAPSCPAGQFASAFPDVPPDHWAYEAVNRLAATPIRCFPVAPRS